MPMRPSTPRTRFQSPLGLVDLHLREVGVVREVEGQTLGQAVLDLAADLLALSGLRIDGVDAFYARERVGRDGRHVARRYLDALQRASPGDLHQAELPGNGGPKRFLILEIGRASCRERE